MKQLLTLTMIAGALFLAQPARAQQQDKQKDNMSTQKMEMMQDSTMMKKMMKNPKMRKMMMHMMMKNMKNDSTMTGMEGMMGGGMPSMCMNMCMKGMDMDMKKMHKKKSTNPDHTKMKKGEG